MNDLIEKKLNSLSNKDFVQIIQLLLIFFLF